MRRASVMTVGVVVALAGCSTGATSYDHRANDVCANVVGAARALPRPAPGTPAADRSFRRLTHARGRALAELAALDPPREDRAAVARMLRHFRESQRFLRDVIRLGESEAILPTLLAAAKEGEKAHRIARRLGLRACADF